MCRPFTEHFVLFNVGLYLTLTLILLTNTTNGGDAPSRCPNDTILSQCTCHDPEYVRCENLANNLTDEKLKTLGNSLSGRWHLLYINNTKITKILDKTFNNSQFESIFIQYNTDLTEIIKDAFTSTNVTTTLVISHNPKLTTDVFDVARAVSSNVSHIEFDFNAIGSIPANAFNSFPNLTYLSLNDQNITIIEKDSFSNLTKLTDLNLKINKIAEIKPGGIDLKLSEKHVSVFLQNNLLNETQIKAETIVIPDKGSVGLDLENNKISSLKDMSFFQKIVENANSFVYLSGNKIECEKCEEFDSFKKIPENQRKNIRGINLLTECKDNVTISKCLE